MYLPLNKQFKMENTIKETEEESNKNVLLEMLVSLGSA